MVCSEGVYQPNLGVLGVPLITVPDTGNDRRCSVCMRRRSVHHRWEDDPRPSNAGHAPQIRSVDTPFDALNPDR
jgi:hypothetical protein